MPIQILGVRFPDAARMFDNVQTFSVGMDMLMIGADPLIALV